MLQYARAGASLSRERRIMSTGPDSEQPVRSALPPADLGVIDAGLAGRVELRSAVQQVRPADLGATSPGGPFPKRAGSSKPTTTGARPPCSAPRIPPSPPTSSRRAIRPTPLASWSSCPRTIRWRSSAPLGAEDRVESRRTPPGTRRTSTDPGLRRDRGRTAHDAQDLALRRGSRSATPSTSCGGTADQIEVAQNCYVVDGDRLVGVVPLCASSPCAARDAARPAS